MSRPYAIRDAITPNTADELRTVHAAIQNHPDVAARAELAEAIGLSGYWGGNRSSSGTGHTPAYRVGALDKESTA